MKGSGSRGGLQVAKKTETKPKKYRFPKDLGACLKALAGLQKQNAMLMAKVQPVQDEEAALRTHLLDTFKKSQLQGAKGSGIVLAVSSTDYPSVEDWPSFYKFARLKGNEDLLQHSVNTPAWRERAGAGKRVPGVKVFSRMSLSVRRSA